RDATVTGVQTCALPILRDAAPRKPATAPRQVSVRLGRRLGLWRSPAVVGVVGLVLLGFAVDGGVGLYQARALRQHRQARVQLEKIGRASCRERGGGAAG